MTFKKLSIGTAAFGMRYGILNNKNGLETYEISKILELSQEAGIQKIDTAFNYDNAQPHTKWLKKSDQGNLSSWNIQWEFFCFSNI